MMIRRPPRAPRTDTPFPTRRCSDRNGAATLAALSASADNGATYTTELAAHQPAQLRLDNIATIIERDSNEIDDLIDNVTLDLFKADDPLNGTIITLEIENDLSAAKGDRKSTRLNSSH